MVIQERKIIQTLLGVGISILEIYDPLNRKETRTLYAVSEFTPSQNNVPEHRILGTDITRIIEEDTLQIAISTDINKILTKISEMAESNVKYSKDYSFRWFIK